MVTSATITRTSSSAWRRWRGSRSGGGAGGGAGPGRGLLAAAEVEEVEEGPGEAAHQVVKQRVRGGGAPGAGQLRGAGGRGHQRGGEQRQGEDLDQRHGGHGLPRVCRYNDD